MQGFWPLVFWLLMLLWAIFGVIPSWPTTIVGAKFQPFASNALLWVLLVILGAYAIGAPGLPGR
jgi:hypothetical protein